MLLAHEADEGDQGTASKVEEVEILDDGVQVSRPRPRKQSQGFNREAGWSAKLQLGMVRSRPG